MRLIGLTIYLFQPFVSINEDNFFFLLIFVNKDELYRRKHRYGEVGSLCSALYEQPRGPKICHDMWGFSEITALLLIRKDLAFIEFIETAIKDCIAEREKKQKKLGRLPFEAVNTFYVICHLITVWIGLKNVSGILKTRNISLVNPFSHLNLKSTSHGVLKQLIWFI